MASIHAIRAEEADSGHSQIPFDDAPSVDSEAALGALNDPDCRDVLAAATGKARTAGELKETCGIPRSTLYRKIDRLTDAGILEEGVRLSPNGAHASEYRCAVEAITVSLSADAGAEVGTGLAGPACD